MWELNHKEGWAPNNWCFQAVVVDKTLESPLDSKEIRPVNPKGNQHWILIGRTEAEAEAPILWPLLMWRANSLGKKKKKTTDAGKDWKQEKVTEGEMVGWHHRLSGHEFEQTLKDSEGQGSLACCSRGIAECQTGLSDWITTKITISAFSRHIKYVIRIKTLPLIAFYWFIYYGE